MQNIVALSKYLMSVIALHLASRAGLLMNFTVGQFRERRRTDRMTVIYVIWFLKWTKRLFTKHSMLNNRAKCIKMTHIGVRDHEYVGWIQMKGMCYVQ